MKLIVLAPLDSATFCPLRIPCVKWTQHDNFLLIFLLKVHVRPALERVLLSKTRRSVKIRIQDVSFTGTRSTAALSHRRPASAETSRDGFGAEDTTDDKPVCVSLMSQLRNQLI